MNELSHIDGQGKALMVDVSHKPDQQRQAEAKGRIMLQPNTIQKIKDNDLKKAMFFLLPELRASRRQRPHQH